MVSSLARPGELHEMKIGWESVGGGCQNTVVSGDRPGGLKENHVKDVSGGGCVHVCPGHVCARVQLLLCLLLPQAATRLP